MTEPVGTPPSADERYVAVADALREWIDGQPIVKGPTGDPTISPVYGAHVLLCDLIRQDAETRAELTRLRAENGILRSALTDIQHTNFSASRVCVECGKQAVTTIWKPDEPPQDVCNEHRVMPKALYETQMELARLRAEIKDMSPNHAPATALPQACEFCGDQGPLLLQARCHLTAPLQVTLDGDVLILRCYVPDCAREVARFKVVRRLATP